MALADHGDRSAQPSNNPTRRMNELKNEFKIAAATVDAPFGESEKDRIAPREQDQLDQFITRFSRCRNTLHFMADLILNSSELADLAVENCWQEASGNLRSFESEGDFRDWIFRLLISESLSMPAGRC
jgi:hypothetical protein